MVDDLLVAQTLESMLKGLNEEARTALSSEFFDKKK
jgi:hypothetical protein